MASKTPTKKLYEFLLLVAPDVDTSGDNKVSREELAEAAEEAVRKAENERRRELTLN